MAQNHAFAQAQEAQTSLVETQRKLAAIEATKSADLGKAEAFARAHAQSQLRAQKLEEQLSAAKASNSLLATAMSKATARAAVMQQDKSKVAPALEVVKQEQIKMQAQYLSDRQEGDAKRLADEIALRAQQAEAASMAAEIALKLHAVKEEQAFARATFESVNQAGGLLSSLKVVQLQGEISIRERR